jgi:hypothetical protein
MKPGMQQGFNGLILIKMLFNDRRNIIWFNATVPGFVWHHSHRWTRGTLSHTITGIYKNIGHSNLLKRSQHRLRTTSETRTMLADKDTAPFSGCGMGRLSVQGFS